MGRYLRPRKGGLFHFPDERNPIPQRQRDGVHPIMTQPAAIPQTPLLVAPCGATEVKDLGNGWLWFQLSGRCYLYRALKSDGDVSQTLTVVN